MKKVVALDMEFNTVGQIQEIISVGAVIMDENLKIVNTYESYIKLSLTKKLDPQAQKIHKIKKETLNDARGFKEVFDELLKILDLNPGDIIITWGNNDKINIGKNSRAHGCRKDFRVLTKRMIDIQPVIQKKIRYKNELIENQLSLENMRKVCGLKDEVSHNALDDAKCLANIYKFANDKEIIKNDKVLDDVFAKQEERKERKRKRLEEDFKIINNFIEKNEQGLILAELSTKSLRQIRAIMKEPRAKHNIRNIAGKKEDIVVKEGYLIKDDKLNWDVNCKISIEDKKLKIEFQKHEQIYFCEIIVCNATVDRIKSLIKTLELSEVN